MRNGSYASGYYRSTSGIFATDCMLAGVLNAKFSDKYLTDLHLSPFRDPHLQMYFTHSSFLLRPSQGLWGTGEKGIYFRGTGEQRSNFEGNRGTKTILGNREHKKINFRFLGNRGTSQFISVEQGNNYPHPLRGPLY